MIVCLTGLSAQSLRIQGWQFLGGEECLTLVRVVLPMSSFHLYLYIFQYLHALRVDDAYEVPASHTWSCTGYVVPMQNRKPAACGTSMPCVAL